MKKFSKILCIALSLVFAFNFVTPAFAADNGVEECPMIIIPGIATSKIYADKDDPTTELPMPDAEYILEFVTDELMPALIVFSANQDTEQLARCITDEINTEFAGWFNNPDGSAKGNAGARCVYPAASAIKAGSTVRFDYDWRGNPIKIAAELKAYVDYIKETGDFDKVALVPHSLGNVVALTYLTLYGFEDIQGVVFDTPAIDGVTYIGEMFCGDIEFSADSVTSLLKWIIGATEYEQLLSSIVDAFGIAGIPELVSVFFNDIIEELMPTILEETLIPLCGSWLSIWAMTPDSYIDAAMESVFNGYYKDEDYSALRANVEAYNNQVRLSKHTTLTAFDEVARVAVISRYGDASLPITPSWHSLSDGVIDTKHSSLGATTAPVGQIFDDEYLEGKDLKYISPDKTVDASTCFFPEKTWFIKNLEHESRAATTPYYASFLFAQEEVTCDTHPTLSRFSIYDAETGEISADDSVPQPVEKPSPWQVLINFLKALFEKFLEFFIK